MIPPAVKASETRHVEHRALRVGDPRLPQDLDAVGDRLDPGVRAAAQRIGAQDDEEHGQHPDARWRSTAASATAPEKTVGSCMKWLTTATVIMKDVGRDEEQEDRHQDLVTLSLTPRRLRMISTTSDEDLHAERVPVPVRGGQEAEELVDSRRRPRSRSSGRSRRPGRSPRRRPSFGPSSLVATR